MGVINAIVMILILALWVVMIIGLINPNRINWKKDESKKLSRGQIFVGGLVGTIILSGIGAMTDPNSSMQQGSAPVPQQTQTTVQTLVDQPAKEKSPSLKITAEDFRKNLNAQLKKADVSYLRPIAEFDLDKGKIRDSFQVTLTKEIGIMGTVNKDGELFGITLIMANSDESGKPAVDMLLLSTMVALAVNSELDGSEAGNMIIDLTKKALEGIDEPDNSHTKVVGKNQYFSIASRQMGLWVGVEPANAKSE